MICNFCGSKNVRMMLDITLSIPGELAHNLSKEAIRRKDVHIWGASWNTAVIICNECHRLFSFARSTSLGHFSTSELEEELQRREQLKQEYERGKDEAKA